MSNKYHYIKLFLFKNKYRKGGNYMETTTSHTEHYKDIQLEWKYTNFRRKKHEKFT